MMALSAAVAWSGTDTSGAGSAIRDAGPRNGRVCGVGGRLEVAQELHWER